MVIGGVTAHAGMLGGVLYGGERIRRANELEGFVKLGHLFPQIVRRGWLYRWAILSGGRS